MQYSQDHADWYDRYYKIEQKDFTSWYIQLLKQLEKIIKPESLLLEVGCGQSKGLRYLVKNDLIKEENIFAIDQSDQAIEFSKQRLPKANLKKGDVYKLEYPENTFDYVLLMETIEHLEYPIPAFKEMFRVLKPGGRLFVSFPNYNNLPWLLLRILSEKFNKPNWINLQPVDKIYGTQNVINIAKKVSFKYLSCAGSNYFPPLLYKYEPELITNMLNGLGLNHLGFHPVLSFEK